MVANFQADLEFSHACSDEQFWLDVYQQVFPDLAAIVDVRKDGWAQRGGIDRLLVTSAGREWKVDEKVRRQSWPDILLEIYSDDKRLTPGWVTKDLACDFIAYAFLPTKECYLMPVAQLQRAWRKHGSRWQEEYGTKRAANDGYWTLSCPVPIPELMHKISQSMYVRVHG